MSLEPTAQQVLEREYLPMRAKILEIAASLDRIQRAEDKRSDTSQLQQIRTAIDTLLQQEPGRAERVQLLFSRSYEQNWREQFQV